MRAKASESECSVMCMHWLVECNWWSLVYFHSASLLSITCKVSMVGGCSLGPGTSSWIYGAYNSFLLWWKGWSGQPRFSVLVPSVSTDTHIHRLTATDRRGKKEKDRKSVSLPARCSLELKETVFSSPIKSISSSTRGNSEWSCLSSETGLLFHVT